MTPAVQTLPYKGEPGVKLKPQYLPICLVLSHHRLLFNNLPLLQHPLISINLKVADHILHQLASSMASQLLMVNKVTTSIQWAGHRRTLGWLYQHQGDSYTHKGMLWIGSNSHNLQLEGHRLRRMERRVE